VNDKPDCKKIHLQSGFIFCKRIIQKSLNHCNFETPCFKGRGSIPGNKTARCYSLPLERLLVIQATKRKNL